MSWNPGEYRPLAAATQSAGDYRFIIFGFAAAAAAHGREMVPVNGLEPLTYRLQGGCSTN